MNQIKAKCMIPIAVLGWTALEGTRISKQKVNRNDNRTKQ